MKSKKVKYKNVTFNANKMNNGFWMASCGSISRIGEDRNQLIKDFGEYLNDLFERINKKK